MTTNVVCIRHPKYKAAHQAPDLSCKVCCRQYVNTILQRQAELCKGEFDTYKWLGSKTNGRQEDNNSPNPGRRSF